MDDLKWISVFRALPPIGKMVITKDRSDVSMGCIKQYNSVKADPRDPHGAPEQYPVWTSTHQVFTPTHWMHFPKSKE